MHSGILIAVFITQFIRKVKSHHSATDSVKSYVSILKLGLQKSY